MPLVRPIVLLGEVTAIFGTRGTRCKSARPADVCAGRRDILKCMCRDRTSPARATCGSLCKCRARALRGARGAGPLRDTRCRSVVLPARLGHEDGGRCCIRPSPRRAGRAPCLRDKTRIGSPSERGIRRAAHGTLCMPGGLGAHCSVLLDGSFRRVAPRSACGSTRRDMTHSPSALCWFPPAWSRPRGRSRKGLREPGARSRAACGSPRTGCHRRAPSCPTPRWVHGRSCTC
jgi:hypothetical protein